VIGAPGIEVGHSLAARRTDVDGESFVNSWILRALVRPMIPALKKVTLAHSIGATGGTYPITTMVDSEVWGELKDIIQAWGIF
jgi:hypothetical protein